MNNGKVWFFLMLLSISVFAFPSWAQENTKKKKKKANVNNTEYNWYLWIAGTGGQLDLPVQVGTSGGVRAGFEYRPNPYLGLGVGLSSANYKIKDKPDPADKILPIFALALGSPLLFILFSDSLFQSDTVSLTATTLDFAVNFHPNKDRVFDPYIGLGIMIGNCTGCNLTGGAARLGMQFNFDNFFFFLQGEFRALSFSGSQGSSVSGQEMQASLGLGGRF